MQSPHQKLRIILGGLVGQYPLGGVAWDYFHYALALAELGHEVYYYEDTWSWPFDPQKGWPVDSPDASVKAIADFFNDYAPHLRENWCFVFLHDKHFGMSRERMSEVAKSADLFINVSGACFFPEELGPKCLKVFMDTDPGYNQIVMQEKPAWSDNVERWVKQVREHDRHLTYAENIYAPDCLIPRMDIDWQPTRCVVTLPPWEKVKNAPVAPAAPFTTIMSWSYFKGDLLLHGVKYDAKAPEYEKFRDLPRQTAVPLAIAVGGTHYSPDKIIADGWNLIDAKKISVTPATYMRFIEDSAGEWSIAKNVYVATRSGWFSCRTACYLAAGRPAIVQDTAWSRYVPSGRGVLAFTTMGECIEALESVARDPLPHRLAAYEIAREYLAPDRVLPPMIEAIYASKRVNPITPGPIPPSKPTVPPRSS